MDDDIVINKKTGRRVRRVVRAKHRDLERDVIELRTGKVITIRAHSYDPQMHCSLDGRTPADVPADEPPVKAKPRRKAKRKAKKKA